MSGVRARLLAAAKIVWYVYCAMALAVVVTLSVLHWGKSPHPGDGHPGHLECPTHVNPYYSTGDDCVWVHDDE